VRSPRVALYTLCILAASFAGAGVRAQAPLANDCSEWHECQRQAESAAAAGEFETFHDLAWRAVQRGPRNDPALMFLLARAQSLSGRPHDAIVMLQRLADKGALSAEAIASDDFRRARQLPSWADIEARVSAHGGAMNAMLPPVSKPPPSTNPSVGASSPAAPSASVSSGVGSNAARADLNNGATPPSLSRSAEAVRFATAPFALGGIAYDAVSQRFLLGDRHARKVIVVGERSDHSVDLVRAASGGFRDIAAIEIDHRRGDLWVASAGDSDGNGLLHKLQLISGRTIKTFPIASDGAPVSPVDVAVTRNGAVVVLDSAAPQLVVLRPGQNTVERAARLPGSDLTSVTIGDDEDTAYVAHGSGISRVNLRSGTASDVGMPAGATAGRIECLRWHGHGLVAVEQTDGMRRIVGITLNDRGTAITRRVTISDNIPGAGRLFAAISGDGLVYVLASDTGQAAAREMVVYRVELP
jgi:streptogramin lyase